jgi:hypothetical protein
MSVAVTLPGAPGTNNATAVTHTATTSHFEWSLPVGRTARALSASTTFVGNQGSVPLATGLTKLGAGSVSTPAHKSSSNTGLVVALSVGGAVVVIAGVLLLLMRRRRSAPAGAHQATPPAADLDTDIES